MGKKSADGTCWWRRRLFSYRWVFNTAVPRDTVWSPPLHPAQHFHPAIKLLHSQDSLLKACFPSRVNSDFAWEALLFSRSVCRRTSAGVCLWKHAREEVLCSRHSERWESCCSSVKPINHTIKGPQRNAAELSRAAGSKGHWLQARGKAR